MEGLRAAQDKMREADVAEQAINVFSDFYGQLEHGATGIIAESDIEPLDGIDRWHDLDYSDEELRVAARLTAVVKLNGGLGTSMGMDKAKSLLPVRGGKSFLDMIVTQVRETRRRYDIDLPLMFMNSYRTQADTLAALDSYRDLRVDDLPLDFLQNREPRLRVDDLMPVEWPDDPELEWCPPGHGDLYTALLASGVLDQLLSAGYKYLSVSNADNLGAVPDTHMMAWFASTGAPYAAEVCRRTRADVKGGHFVVRRSDGRMVLRETAQTAPEDAATAADLDRHKFFNTNNLWFDLEAMAEILKERDGVLGLPLIRNVKHVVPADKATPEVLQIESAMGAAVEVFDGATAIEVPRSRFLPVKTTNDLLLLRSNVYEQSEDGSLAARIPAPLINLDKRYFATVTDFDARISEPPSLLEATSLTVEGDWSFGVDVTIRGAVELEDLGSPQRVADATTLIGG